VSGPLLSVKNLSISKPSGERLVGAVSFTLKEGESVALIGASGAGKSTLLKALMQLPNAGFHSEGTILFQGKSLRSLSFGALKRLRGQSFCYLPQDAVSALNPVIRLGAQLKEALRLHTRLKRSAERRRIDETLQAVGLESAVLKKYRHQISGGMAVRFLLAMALINRPRLLASDELTAALDPQLRRQIMRLIAAYQQNHAMTHLFISHDLTMVGQYASRVLVISEQRLSDSLPAAAFFARHSSMSRYARKILEAYTSLRNSKPPAGFTVAARPPVLKAEHLTKIYRRPFLHRIIDDMSFNVQLGETVALLGPSGSGKSTLARQFLTGGAGGHVFVEGHDLFSSSSKERRAAGAKTAVILQESALAFNPYKPFMVSLTEGITRLYGSRPATEEALGFIMEKCRLNRELLQRYPYEVSGGERQRFALARALLFKARLLICDEITGALDIILKKEVLTLLKELQRQYNFGCLFITHDYEAARFMADYLLLIENGKIVKKMFPDQFQRVYDSLFGES
jgi:peptide/nickel transport system ATP-binding protein